MAIGRGTQSQGCQRTNQPADGSIHQRNHPQLSSCCFHCGFADEMRYLHVFSLGNRMTKGRVAVGKIESWLQKFESCSRKTRQKGTGAWQSATVRGREIAG